MLKPIAFGTALKRARLALVPPIKSQEKLAERLKVSFQLVQKLEQGKTGVSHKRAAKIAKALGLPSDYFHDAVALDEEARRVNALPSVATLTIPGRIRTMLFEVMPGDENAGMRSLTLGRALQRLPDAPAKYELIRMHEQLEKPAK